MWERVENIVGKGENTGYQHFLLFPLCFRKLSFPEVWISGLYFKGGPSDFGMKILENY